MPLSGRLLCLYPSVRATNFYTLIYDKDTLLFPRAIYDQQTQITVSFLDT